MDGRGLNIFYHYPRWRSDDLTPGYFRVALPGLRFVIFVPFVSFCENESVLMTSERETRNAE